MPSDSEQDELLPDRESLQPQSIRESAEGFTGENGIRSKPSEIQYGLEDKQSPRKGLVDDKKGHRQRLRDKILTNGASFLAEYELLEVLLFAASPRADTKPLAKRLISEFGSLSNVMNASPERLRKIDNVGDAVVATIKVAELLGERLLRSKIEK
ncbi:MAG: hypothetical protein JKX94_05635, partial [Sneathiella sp.]|nr:hypothetical protein [Sneathiella sp.]